MINVSTGEFFGPFDLLLDLIKKSKYDIYEVRLSDITNKYIASLKTMDIPADETADFILIATQLLYIKTRSLIKDTMTEVEEEDFVSQEELLNRLIEYKKIKSILPIFFQLEDEGLLKHVKLQEDLSKYKEKEDVIDYDILSLKKYIEKVIGSLLNNNEFQVDKILDIEEYSLEKYNSKIKIQLIKEKIISISSMIKKIDNKSEVIIIFLSILELSKNKNLYILQDQETMEITVKLHDESDTMDENGVKDE